VVDENPRMLLAEYHVPAGMAMEPPEEVKRLYQMGSTSVQVDVLPDGVQHVRWWYTGAGGNGGQ
jgi:hypothetical protein